MGWGYVSNSRESQLRQPEWGWLRALPSRMMLLGHLGTHGTGDFASTVLQKGFGGSSKVTLVGFEISLCQEPRESERWELQSFVSRNSGVWVLGYTGHLSLSGDIHFGFLGFFFFFFFLVTPRHIELPSQGSDPIRSHKPSCSNTRSTVLGQGSNPQPSTPKLFLIALCHSGSSWTSMFIHRHP